VYVFEWTAYTQVMSSPKRQFVHFVVFQTILFCGEGKKTEQLKRLTGGFSLSEWRSGGVEYRERGRKGNSMCLSISWDCLNRSRILNARYIFQRRAARPRTPFRSLEFLFFF